MGEPLTIYECPECGAVALARPLDEGQAPPVLCSITHPMPREVRVFREEDVRPFWDALHDLATLDGPFVAWLRDVLDPVLDAFPAPEEWKASKG